MFCSGDGGVLIEVIAEGVSMRSGASRFAPSLGQPFCVSGDCTSKAMGDYDHTPWLFFSGVGEAYYDGQQGFCRTPVLLGSVGVVASLFSWLFLFSVYLGGGRGVISCCAVIGPSGLGVEPLLLCCFRLRRLGFCDGDSRNAVNEKNVL